MKDLSCLNLFTNPNNGAVDQILVFDLWGQYGHYKKIFATTSALTYPIPVKTSLYGLFGALIGLEKQGNAYLKYFEPGQCQVGIQVLKPLSFQQININLRAVFGSMKPNDNRKPTMMEFVYRPRYRIFVKHEDPNIFNDLCLRIKNKEAVFTPTLGLASLLANYQWIGAFDYEVDETQQMLPIQTVFPRRQLIQIDHNQAFSTQGNRIMEVSQYALEMDIDRNVTDRDDIILDLHGKSIMAKVKQATRINIDNQILHAVIF